MTFLGHVAKVVKHEKKVINSLEKEYVRVQEDRVQLSV
jgi:hypothetical protein